MKKLLAMVLALLMILTMTSAMAEPFGEGKTLSLSCLEGWYSAVTINDNLPIWQIIEENTGVHIEWEAISDYDTAMQPRVAAGQELPDMMLITPSWSNAGVYKMALDGTIIPLDDLIEEHAPNIKKLLEENPVLKGLITAPDGHIYSICDAPMFVNDAVVNESLMIREDWLKEFGLEVPETLEDWYEVLTAFKGKSDTMFGLDVIPYGTSGDVRSKVDVFTCAFGLPSAVGMWWYDEEGKVFFTYTTEEYKAYLTEMAKWYAEGLIDVENRDESNHNSLISTDVVGAFAGLDGYWEQANGLLASSGVEGNYVLVAPPASGDKLLMKRDSTWNHYGITKYCDDPVTAIKWMDYVWGSDEGVTITEWGILGETYDIDENGNKYYTDYVRNNPDGLDPYNSLRVLGASNTIMVRTPAEVYFALVDEHVSNFGKSLMDQRCEPFPQVMATEEEQKVIDRINPDLTTYCNEMIEKFITGIEPIENFDAFVAKVSEIGMEELLEVKQAHYDRANAQ